MNPLIQHRQFVLDLQNHLKQGNTNICPPCASAPMSHTMRHKNYKSYVNSLNIRALNSVLEINEKEKFIVVEPGITMNALVLSTLPFGLIPPVIPEFKGITVGGAINGAALESSSHHFGQFNDICLSYEVLTPEGAILIASPEENSELFYAFAGSYGTLGFLLSVKIQLISHKPMIKLNYKQFPRAQEALDFLEFLHKETIPPLVIEAIVFPKKTVVIYGSFTSDETPTARFSRFYDPWFYAHVDSVKDGHIDIIPLYDYLFRHDRGAFWMAGYSLHPAMISRYLFHKLATFFNLNENLHLLKPKFCRPKNPGFLFRYLLGGIASSGFLYKSLHKKSEGWFQKYFVIQDFYLPKLGASTFISHILDKYQITPLWICPIKATTKEQLFSPHRNFKTSLLFDVGVYGIPSNSNAELAVRDLETLTHQLNGLKMFYCSTYLTSEQFWKLYPESIYRDLRKKYAAEKIPDITEKVLI